MMAAWNFPYKIPYRTFFSQFEHTNPVAKEFQQLYKMIFFTLEINKNY